MTLRHFKIFLRVCEEENMTSAAEKLHMSQPPVSQAISELEEHYGTKLFDRSGRRIMLNPAGQELLAYASHIISLVEESEHKLRDLSLNGPIRLGCSVTIATTVLPDLLNRFALKCPQNPVHFQVENTSQIIFSLQKAELDLGLVEGIPRWPDMVVKDFYQDELVLICSKNHPWVLRKALGIKELQNQEFLIREPGSGTREVFEAAMMDHSISWSPAGVLNNNEAILELVSQNLGIAFVSDLACSTPQWTNRVCKVRIPDLFILRQFCLVHHKNKKISPNLQNFIQLLDRSKPSF